MRTSGKTCSGVKCDVYVQLALEVLLSLDFVVDLDLHFGLCLSNS